MIIKSYPTTDSAAITYNPYVTQDIDFFVIEAHNRTVSLILIEDVSNAKNS